MTTELGNTRVTGDLDKSPFRGVMGTEAPLVLSPANHGPKKFFPGANLQDRKELTIGAVLGGNFSIVCVDR